MPATSSATRSICAWSRERPPGAVRLLIIAHVGLAFAYLGWRWGVSIPWEHWLVAVPIAVAETYTLLGMALFNLTVWRAGPRLEAPRPPDRSASVDVFVTCYGEPIEVVRQTVRAAVAVAHPYQTYLLDDGGAAPVEAMARDEGAHYLARSASGTPEDAKAGNLNHALARTEGEFVLVLDADQVAQPAIVDRLLGYFDDKRVAFVQTPQWSRGVSAADSFPVQTPLFNGPVQRGKEGWNAALFTGSNAVLRRAALESLEARTGEAVATYSLTEDLATTIRLDAAGWRGVYHDEVLATGLAPRDLAGLASQRGRWASGVLQVLLRANPLRVHGLSSGQRLMYLETLLRGFAGFATAVFITGCALALAAGLTSAREYSGAFLWLAIPLITTHQALMFVAGRRLHTWRERALSVALFAVEVGAVAAVVRAARSGRPIAFRVTQSADANAHGTSSSVVAWPLAAAALLVGAAIVGVVRLVVGQAEDGVGVLVHLAGAAYLLANLAVLVPAASYRAEAPVEPALMADAARR